MKSEVIWGGPQQRGAAHGHEVRPHTLVDV